MTITIRISEVRNVPGCYHVKMGNNISWVTEDAIDPEEALGMFVSTFVSSVFNAELRYKYEVNGVIRYLYAVTLPTK